MLFNNSITSRSFAEGNEGKEGLWTKRRMTCMWGGKAQRAEVRGRSVG